MADHDDDVASTALASNEFAAWLGPVLRATSLEVYVIDPATSRCLHPNRAACAALGYSEAELVGMSIFELAPTLAPESFSEAAELLRIGQTSEIVLECSHRRSDSTTYPAEIRLSRMAVNGHHVLVGLVRDLTGARPAQVELRETRERLEVAIHAAELSTWEADLTGAATLYDARMSEMLGRDIRPWITDAEWGAFIHPNDVRTVRANWIAHLRGLTKFYESEFRAQSGSGDWRWLHSRGSVVERDGHGRALRAAGATRDITDQKRSQEALAESEAQLAAMFESFRDLVLILDAEGRVLRLNRQSKSVTPIRGRIAEGDLFHDWLLPEERPDFDRNLSAVMGGESFTGEWKVGGLSGPIWVEMSLFPIKNENPTSRSAVLVARDISERKRMEGALAESEAELRALFQSSRDLVMIIEADGRIVRVNREAVRTTSPRGPYLAGRNLFEYLRPEDEDEFRSGVAAALAGEIATIEIQGAGQDGEEWFELVFSPIESAADEPGRVALFARDMTERRQADHALAESEEKFSKAFSANPVAMTITTDDELPSVVDVNAAYERFSGHRRNEVVGGPTGFSFVDSEAAPQLRRQYERDGFVRDVEVDLRSKSGEVRTALLSLEPIELGGKRCKLSVVRDITEQKRAELGLRESERKYREIASHVPGVVFQFKARRDGSVDLTYVSPRSRDLFGVDPDVAMSPDWDLEAALHPDDRTLILGSLLQAVADGSSWHCEGRTVTPAGDVKWFQGMASPSEHGNELVFDGLLLDITERKLAELAQRESDERFSIAFQSSPVPMVILRREDHWIVDVNGRFVELFGYERSSVIGKTAYELGMWVVDAQREALLEQLLDDSAVRDAEAQLRTASGDVRDVMLSVSPVQLAGEPGLLAVLHDVTEQKQTQGQLLQAQKMESVGRLAGGIAHDFNNLLTVINGYSQLAAASLEEESDAQKNLKMVVEAARTAAGLTRQLLALSRQQPVTPKNIDVNDLVLDSTKLLLRILGEDIRLTCARTSEPLICHIDPTQFDQVILNLVVNARDAMPFGGNITVQTHPGTDVERSRWGWPDMPPGDYAVVEVTDTGTGIPPQIVPKIFEPFFTTKEVGKGTGLGLSTCYGIVKQAGGHIAVASEPGAGTTFTVFLPRVSALSATADLPEVPMPLTREDSSVILLVEDQKDLRTLAERALSAHGYTVVSTASPQEALEAARCARHIDLILSDLVMPGMDGAALLDELTAILGPRPALIMSGHAEESLLARIAGRSEVAFISKPFTLDSLVAEIQRTFGGWTDTVMVDGHASACD